MSNYHWKVTFIDEEGFSAQVDIQGSHPMNRMRIINKAMNQLKSENPWQQDRTHKVVRRLYELLAHFNKVTIDVIKYKPRTEI